MSCGLFQGVLIRGLYCRCTNRHPIMLHIARRCPRFIVKFPFPRSVCVFLWCAMHSCPCMTVQACGQLRLPQPHWGLCTSCWQDWSCRVGLHFSQWGYPQVVHMCILVVVFCRQRGKALSFITRDNWKWARELCNILAEAEQVRHPVSKVLGHYMYIILYSFCKSLWVCRGER